MSLDPESLLGVKSAVLKAAVAGTLLGVVWRRDFTLGQALSSGVAGLGSGIWIAPMALAHSGIVHEDVRRGVIFIVGLTGVHIFTAITTYAPLALRKLIGGRLGVELPPVDDPKKGGGA